ncbi:GreA/GreB family elongation factor [Streptomyces rubellomurinus]|uniref:Nucleoside diphosphate kinase regulator n=1 Tax=Streptomyces rubellomurinus (strain ATCC 31215) TaxID=359131 RepID=A0A0F2T637_STRR3|nr:GreA/GreB family elongation factor [Streptomyces rubellomurinus]KJS58679.1 nucleoside diphosphate kinase regulator [Streptomyces rubellomurinus]
MSGGPEPISAEGLRVAQEELARLRAEREKAAGTLRGEDDAVGDRADEADELRRAAEVARLDDRIAEVEGRLEEAAVAGAPATDVVGVGSTVSLRFADGEEEVVEVSELAEVGERTLVTWDSPLGKALIGCHTGETVAYDTPVGAASATVLSIGGSSTR